MKDRRFAILFLTIFLDLLGFGLVIPVLPSYAKDLAGGSDIMMGMIIACFSVAQFFSTPIFGGLSDRIGRRPILVFTLLGNCIGYLILSQAVSLPILIAARVVSGFCSGNLSVAQAYISDISSKENRTKAMGMIGAAFGMGFILGPPLGGFLQANYGFASLGYFSAVMCFINFILAIFFLKESLLVKNLNSKIRILPIKDFIKVFENKVYRRLFIISFIFISGFFLFQIPSPLLWKEHYNLDTKQIGYLFAVIGICTSIVQAGLVGKMSKVLGDRKMIVLGNVLLGLSICFLPFIPISVFWYIEIPALFMIALGNGMMNPALGSYLSKNTDPMNQGKMLGLYQSFGSLARIFGPLIGASLYSINIFVPFLSAIVLFGINAVLALGLQAILNKNPFIMTPKEDIIVSMEQ